MRTKMKIAMTLMAQLALWLYVAAGQVVPETPPTTEWKIQVITEISEGNKREGFTVEMKANGATRVYHWKNEGWCSNWHETTDIEIPAESLTRIYDCAAKFIREFALSKQQVESSGKTKFSVGIEMNGKGIGCRRENVESVRKASQRIGELIDIVNQYLPKEKQIH